MSALPFPRETRLARRGSQHPLLFPTDGWKVIPENFLLEEEGLPHFYESGYYPVDIGEIFNHRYQVVGKLGYGVSSTVWLARDLRFPRHVALKVYTRDDSQNSNEYEAYGKLSMSNPDHPGYAFVTKALDRFVIPRRGGDHKCLVMKPMWSNCNQLLQLGTNRRFPPPLVKEILRPLILALDYFHTECEMVHTDIKADNILVNIDDASLFDKFVDAEMADPSARKQVGGLTIYESRQFDDPEVFGRAMLSDYGSSVAGHVLNYVDAQPSIYRSPECMLLVPWTYPIDIWNVGCMTWNLLEGKRLFSGLDPDGKGYSTRQHLAEVIALIGPPPLDLLKRGKRMSEFFTRAGEYKWDIEIPTDYSLEESEDLLEGEDKELFLKFIRKMLRWRPEDRYTARELLEDPWLNDEFGPRWEKWVAEHGAEETEEAEEAEGAREPERRGQEQANVEKRDAATSSKEKTGGSTKAADDKDSPEKGGQNKKGKSRKSRAKTKKNTTADKSSDKQGKGGNK